MNWYTQYPIRSQEFQSLKTLGLKLDTFQQGESATGFDRSNLRTLSDGGSPIRHQFLALIFLNRMPQVEKEGKAGVYKELAILSLLELFLRNSSRNSRGRQVFDILFVLFSNGGGSI